MTRLRDRPRCSRSRWQPDLALPRGTVQLMGRSDGAASATRPRFCRLPMSSESHSRSGNSRRTRICSAAAVPTTWRVRGRGASSVADITDATSSALTPFDSACAAPACTCRHMVQLH